MTRYPYPVGAQVAGADCSGKAFTGTVTELLGPYTVKLDELYATPVSLIHGVVENCKPDVNYSDPMQEPAPEPAAQLSLF